MTSVTAQCDALSHSSWLNFAYFMGYHAMFKYKFIIVQCTLEEDSARKNPEIVMQLQSSFKLWNSKF